jgi:hypothetical protein
VNLVHQIGQAYKYFNVNQIIDNEAKLELKGVEISKICQ